MVLSPAPPFAYGKSIWSSDWFEAEVENARALVARNDCFPSLTVDWIDGRTVAQN